MPTINVSDALYARLAKHAVGFATPESVIEMLLNEHEGLNVGKTLALDADSDSDKGRILKMHNELFQFLRKRNVVFMPRQQATERLSQGYWFIGNGNYLAVGFCTGNDDINHTPNITFHVYLSNFYLNSIGKPNASIPLCCIQLSNTPGSKGWENKQPVINQIKKELGGFECNRIKDGIEGRWNRYFEHRDYNATDYLECLDDFLTKDKPVIDEIIKNAKNPDIGFLDNNKVDRKINAIEKLRNQF
ncbi:MAG: hypothetical protein WCH01_09780 [Methylococcaceae bacterium]